MQLTSPLPVAGMPVLNPAAAESGISAEVAPVSPSASETLVFAELFNELVASGSTVEKGPAGGPGTVPVLPRERINSKVAPVLAGLPGLDLPLGGESENFGREDFAASSTGLGERVDLPGEEPAPTSDRQAADEGPWKATEIWCPEAAVCPPAEAASQAIATESVPAQDVVDGPGTGNRPMIDRATSRRGNFETPASDTPAFSGEALPIADRSPQLPSRPDAPVCSGPTPTAAAMETGGSDASTAPKSGRAAGRNPDAAAVVEQGLPTADSVRSAPGPAPSIHRVFSPSGNAPAGFATDFSPPEGGRAGTVQAPLAVPSEIRSEISHPTTTRFTATQDYVTDGPSRREPSRDVATVLRPAILPSELAAVNAPARDAGGGSAANLRAEFPSLPGVSLPLDPTADATGPTLSAPRMAPNGGPPPVLPEADAPVPAPMPNGPAYVPAKENEVTFASVPRPNGQSDKLPAVERGYAPSDDDASTTTSRTGGDDAVVRSDGARPESLAGGQESGRPAAGSGGRAANLAAVYRENPPRAEVPVASPPRSFLNSSHEEFARGEPVLGTGVAESSPVMSARNPHRQPSPESPLQLFAAQATMMEANGSSRASSSLRSTTAAGAAQRAVRTVMDAVSQFAPHGPQAVNFRFSVGGSDLAVRVELRSGEIHATFRTDSTELRSALAAEWQAVSGSEAGRTLRTIETVFAPTRSSGAGVATDDGAPSQQREADSRHSGESGRGRTFGLRKPELEVASAAAAPVPSIAPAVTALRLHTFA